MFEEVRHAHRKAPGGKRGEKVEEEEEDEPKKQPAKKAFKCSDADCGLPISACR